MAAPNNNFEVICISDDEDEVSNKVSPISVVNNIQRSVKVRTSPVASEVLSSQPIFNAGASSIAAITSAKLKPAQECQTLQPSPPLQRHSVHIIPSPPKSASDSSISIVSSDRESTGISGASEEEWYHVGKFIDETPTGLNTTKKIAALPQSYVAHPHIDQNGISRSELLRRMKSEAGKIPSVIESQQGRPANINAGLPIRKVETDSPNLGQETVSEQQSKKVSNASAGLNDTRRDNGFSVQIQTGHGYRTQSSHQTKAPSLTGQKRPYLPEKDRAALLNGQAYQPFYAPDLEGQRRKVARTGTHVNQDSKISPSQEKVSKDNTKPMISSARLLDRGMDKYTPTKWDRIISNMPPQGEPQNLKLPKDFSTSSQTVQKSTIEAKVMTQRVLDLKQIKRVFRAVAVANLNNLRSEVRHGEMKQIQAFAKNVIDHQLSGVDSRKRINDIEHNITRRLDNSKLLDQDEVVLSAEIDQTFSQEWRVTVDEELVSCAKRRVDADLGIIEAKKNSRQGSSIFQISPVNSPRKRLSKEATLRASLKRFEEAAHIKEHSSRELDNINRQVLDQESSDEDEDDPSTQSYQQQHPTNTDQTLTSRIEEPALPVFEKPKPVQSGQAPDTSLLARMKEKAEQCQKSGTILDRSIDCGVISKGQSDPRLDVDPVFDDPDLHKAIDDNAPRCWQYTVLMTRQSVSQTGDLEDELVGTFIDRHRAVNRAMAAVESFEAEQIEQYPELLDVKRSCSEESDDKGWEKQVTFDTVPPVGCRVVIEKFGVNPSESAYQNAKVRKACGGTCIYLVDYEKRTIKQSNSTEDIEADKIQEPGVVAGLSSQQDQNLGTDGEMPNDKDDDSLFGDSEQTSELLIQNNEQQDTVQQLLIVKHESQSSAGQIFGGQVNRPCNSSQSVGGDEPMKDEQHGEHIGQGQAMPSTEADETQKDDRHTVSFKAALSQDTDSEMVSTLDEDLQGGQSQESKRTTESSTSDTSMTDTAEEEQCTTEDEDEAASQPDDDDDVEMTDPNTTVVRCNGDKMQYFTCLAMANRCAKEILMKWLRHFPSNNEEYIQAQDMQFEEELQRVKDFSVWSGRDSCTYEIEDGTEYTEHFRVWVKKVRAHGPAN